MRGVLGRRAGKGVLSPPPGLLARVEQVGGWELAWVPQVEAKGLRGGLFLQLFSILLW